MNLDKELTEFAEDNKMLGKGPLCVALIVTKHAQTLGMPLNSEELMTEGEGQVKGLGKNSVQAILKQHGINNVLAKEAGRTSRGSIAKMKKYVAFLNSLYIKHDYVDLKNIEHWWVDRVKEFFSAKPFKLRLDTSKSMRTMFADLLSQAAKRQTQNPGTNYVGTMLQHLVGAKLTLLLGKHIAHHGASVADDCLNRAGDFLLEDVAIHVTTSPTEELLKKCQQNLDDGLRPVIITITKGVVLAEGLAEQIEIQDRLDVFEAEQFLAGNMYEIGKFGQSGRIATAKQLIEEYNSIVLSCETDPSLRVE